MMLPRSAKTRLRAWLDPLSKARFIIGLAPSASVLDVGCGNGSPSFFKRLNPSIRYTGLDIAEHGLEAADHAAADELIFVPSERFAEGITGLGARFDAVVSAHNIEHVEQPEAVLRSMCSVLRPAGRIYVSFPSTASVDFPSRGGCLNFYDDPTHRWLPDLAFVRGVMERCGCRVVVDCHQNQPYIGRVLGAIEEPMSRRRSRVMSFTWHYWGFESVVIAERAAQSRSAMWQLQT